MKKTFSSEQSCCFSHPKSWPEHSLPELSQDLVDRAEIPLDALDRLVGVGHENPVECRSMQGCRLWNELTLLSPEAKKNDYLWSRQWDVWALREDIQITKNRKKSRKRKRHPETDVHRGRIKKVNFRFDVVDISSGHSLELREKEGNGGKWRRFSAKTHLTRGGHTTFCSLLHTPLHCHLNLRCPDLKAPWQKSWEHALEVTPKGELHDLLKKAAYWLRLSGKTLEDSDGRWLYLQKQRELLSKEEYKVVQLLPGIIDALETGEKKIIETLKNCFNVSFSPCRLAFLVKSYSREVQAHLNDLRLLSEGATGPLCVKVKNQRKILRAQSFIRFSENTSAPRNKEEEGRELEQMFRLLEEMNVKIYVFTRRRMNFQIFSNTESFPDVSELETLRKAVNNATNKMRNRFCSNPGVGVSGHDGSCSPARWKQYWLKASAGHFLLAKNARAHPDLTWLSLWKNRHPG